MRCRLIAVIGLAILSLGLSSPAAAKCAVPVSPRDSAARAVAVVYGIVTDASAGAVTLRVDRVLKGQVSNSVRVFVGPGRGGGPTSVDYLDIGRLPEVGSDHVLYIVRGGDGQLETDACVGSHPGPPDATEVAFFGLVSPASAPPAASAPAAEPVLPAPSATSPAILAALILAIIVAVAVLPIIRRRRV